MTWSVAGGADATLFAIAPDTGTLRFVAAPDFEGPADANRDNRYEVVVQAADAAGNASQQAMTVTVTDADETDTAPPRISGPTSPTVSENQTAVAELAADKPVTWSVAGGADATLFAIAPDTGTLRFVAAPDFEGPADANRDNRYEVVVQAADAAGNASQQAMTVTVTDADETDTVPPRISGPTSPTVSENQTAVAELAADKPVTWSVAGGADATLFAIAPDTGTLRFVAAPDFEGPADANRDNRYEVVVQAADAAGNASQQAMTVTVTDADETDTVPPRISGPTSPTVSENQTAVAELAADKPVTWSVAGGADATLFAIAPDTGTLRFVAAPDFEGPADANRDNRYEVVVQAADAAGNASQQAMTVTVTDADETDTVPPRISGPTSPTVSENQTAVAELAADKPVTWSVAGGADATLFAIAPDTGTLRFVAAPDFEGPADTNRDNRYEVVVQAADAAGNASQQAMTVTVTNARRDRHRAAAHQRPDQPDGEREPDSCRGACGRQAGDLVRRRRSGRDAVRHRAGHRHAALCGGTRLRRPRRCQPRQPLRGRRAGRRRRR